MLAGHPTRRVTYSPSCDRRSLYGRSDEVNFTLTNGNLQYYRITGALDFAKCAGNGSPCLTVRGSVSLATRTVLHGSVSPRSTQVPLSSSFIAEYQRQLPAKLCEGVCMSGDLCQRDYICHDVAGCCSGFSCLTAPSCSWRWFDVH